MRRNFLPLIQFNIAVIGDKALGITLQKYLSEHGSPVNLGGYLAELALLSSSATNPETRLALYLKMYTAPSYLKNPETEPITTTALTAASSSLEVKKISYQSFEERAVLRGVNEILFSYRSFVGTNVARDIYFNRCWV